MLTMLVSCGDDLVSLNEDIKYSNVPMSFACTDTTNYITRGSQTNSITEFVVNARYFHENSLAGRDFLSDQKVVWSASPAQWTYSPQKYWPEDGSIDFYAFSPSAIKGTFESLTLNRDIYPTWLLRYNVSNPVITTKDELTGSTITASVFQKAKDADNQQDILLAVLPKVNCTSMTVTSKVNMSFVHALAGLNLQFKSDNTFPIGTTDIILAIAPMCTGGTIAFNASPNELRWTLDESEATFYQGYTLNASNQIDTNGKTFFLPPQELKNFTIIARFYKKDAAGSYTLLGTKTSNRNTLKLERGKTTTITLKN